MLDTAVRASGRAKQEMLVRMAPLRVLADMRYHRRLRRFEPRLPMLPQERQAVLDDVRTRGAAVTSLDALALPRTDELKAGLVELRRDLERSAPRDEATVRQAREQIVEQASVWQWGLSEPLLDMVENYLGLPARYHGAGLRCERATGEAVGVRQWHRDIEDRQMLKLLVWLNDVDDDGGPFEYVDRRHTETLATSLRYVSGYVGDDELERQVPRSEWRRGTGPMWTCVFADPRNIFHRAMPPIRRDRYSLTFTYTSRSPIRILPISSISPRERAIATRGLNARQLACLPRAYTK